MFILIAGPCNAFCHREGRDATSWCIMSLRTKLSAQGLENAKMIQKYRVRQLKCTKDFKTITIDHVQWWDEDSSKVDIACVAFRHVDTEVKQGLISWSQLRPTVWRPQRQDENLTNVLSLQLCWWTLMTAPPSKHIISKWFKKTVTFPFRYVSLRPNICPSFAKDLQNLSQIFVTQTACYPYLFPPFFPLAHMYHSSPVNCLQHCSGGSRQQRWTQQTKQLGWGGPNLNEANQEPFRDCQNLDSFSGKLPGFTTSETKHTYIYVRIYRILYI